MPFVVFVLLFCSMCVCACVGVSAPVGKARALQGVWLLDWMMCVCFSLHVCLDCSFIFVCMCPCLCLFLCPCAYVISCGQIILVLIHHQFQRDLYTSVPSVEQPTSPRRQHPTSLLPATSPHVTSIAAPPPPTPPKKEPKTQFV